MTLTKAQIIEMIAEQICLFMPFALFALIFTIRPGIIQPNHIISALSENEVKHAQSVEV
jgi:hypothetical protein